MPDVDLLQGWRSEQSWSGKSTIEPQANPNWTPSWTQPGGGGLISVTGLDDVKATLRSLHEGLRGPVLRDALYAAANVYRDAIESATPVRTGTAKSAVIVYERKRSKKELSFDKGDVSLLVGYDKKSAFYMYWYEMGTSKQAARPFFRSTCDGVESAAIAAAEAVISAAVERAA